MNSHIVFTGLDVMGVAHAHRDVGAGVLFGIGGSGHQLAHVEARIVRHVYNFLAGRRLSLSDNLRSDGVRNGVIEHEAQSLRVAIEQVTHTATTGEQADRHACAWMALHVVEYHRGTLFSGTRHRSTGADVAVYTGKLRHRIHFNIGFDKLTVNALEQLKSATQIVDLIRHCSSNSASCCPTMQATLQYVAHHLRKDLAARYPKLGPCSDYTVKVVFPNKAEGEHAPSPLPHLPKRPLPTVNQTVNKSSHRPHHEAQVFFRCALNMQPHARGAGNPKTGRQRRGDIVSGNFISMTGDTKETHCRRSI